MIAASRMRGVDRRHTTPGKCMVVGCAGKALYRSPDSRHDAGYCRQHKDLAVVTARHSESHIESFMRRKVPEYRADFYRDRRRSEPDE